MDQKIVIRNAVPEDAPFIAECVLAAIGMYDFKQKPEMLKDLEAVCASSDTLYSWKNTRMAVIQNPGCQDIKNTTVGCLISYPGEFYMEARDRTWQQGFAGGKKEDYSSAAMETGEGEYYLDTMAILPAFRGFGIGKLLLQDGIRKGHTKGYEKITLIVDKEHQQLHEYYGSIGFHDIGEILFFGTLYTKMSI